MTLNIKGCARVTDLIHDMSYEQLGTLKKMINNKIREKETDIMFQRVMDSLKEKN